MYIHTLLIVGLMFTGLSRPSMAVELEMATMAAKKRTAKQMKSIWSALEAFDKQIESGNDAVKEDIAFHLAIADASDNPYFARFIKYIGEGVIPGVGCI